MFLSRMPGPAAPERRPPITSESPSRAENFLAETGHGGARDRRRRPPRAVGLRGRPGKLIYSLLNRKPSHSESASAKPGLESALVPQAESAPPEEPGRAAVRTPNGATLAVTPGHGWWWPCAPPGCWCVLQSYAVVANYFLPQGPSSWCLGFRSDLCWDGRLVLRLESHVPAHRAPPSSFAGSAMRTAGRDAQQRFLGCRSADYAAAFSSQRVLWGSKFATRACQEVPGHRSRSLSE